VRTAFAGIPEIGRCIGCDHPSRLHHGVCGACLTRRGRRWAEISHRCRTDPEFALAIFGQLTTDRGRGLFLAVYGAAALRGRGSTIAQVLDDASGGPWAWEAELTAPPPPQPKG
jgi:hypothetical protein